MNFTPTENNLYILIENNLNKRVYDTIYNNDRNG